MTDTLEMEVGMRIVGTNRSRWWREERGGKKILGEAQLAQSMHEIAFIKLVTLCTN